MPRLARPQAVPPLAVSLIGEGANTVLSGIMRGCGRQKIGATVNLVRLLGTQWQDKPKYHRILYVNNTSLEQYDHVCAYMRAAMLLCPRFLWGWPVAHKAAAF